MFSDSHTDVPTMLSVVHAQHPDAILHLGDHFADGLLLQKQTDLRTHLVKGNTDQEYDASEEELITFEKTRVYMTHGHKHNVQDGLSKLYDTGVRNNARIILFGHTHKPMLSCIDGIWLMNPGRIGRISSKIIHATYGSIAIAGNRISCTISEV